MGQHLVPHMCVMVKLSLYVFTQDLAPDDRASLHSWLAYFGSTIDAMIIRDPFLTQTHLSTRPSSVSELDCSTVRILWIRVYITR